MKFLNTPYVYGASRKDGFDCSGFVHFVFLIKGLNIYLLHQT